MKTHLDDVRDQWWSLTDEHRAELREEFRKRMATDDAFSRTTAILLELHDKNAALEARLRALEDALRRYLVSHETDVLLNTGQRGPCGCDVCKAARAALAAAETGEAVTDADTIRHVPPELIFQQLLDENKTLEARIRCYEAALREIRRTATNIGDRHVPDLLARLDAIETIAALADAEEKP